MKTFWITRLAFLLLLPACVRKQEDMSGPTIGQMSIIADQTLQYLVEQQEEVFEREYKYTTLDISYQHEMDMMQAFYDDSIDVIITNRNLTAEEYAFFEKRKQFPRATMFATSAIAFIRHRSQADTTITYENLVASLKSAEDGTVFVLENSKSGIAGELLRLLDVAQLPSHIFALPTKAAVLEYVATQPKAIGIIDYTDISDSDSAYTKDVLSRYYLMGISRPADSVQVGFVQPFQYNLQDRKYPFTRDLHFITKTGKTDVATGFIAFIAGEIGQKIVLKSGLLPKFQAERWIELTNTSDIKVVQ
jgi:phosphate transport system substrate-binding protein